MHHIEVTEGKRFGSLVAVKKIGGECPQAGKYWQCKCDCGGTTLFYEHKLLSGEKTSCGCSHKKQKDIE